MSGVQIRDRTILETKQKLEKMHRQGHIDVQGQKVDQSKRKRNATFKGIRQSKYEVNDKSSRVDEVSLTIMGNEKRGDVGYL